MTNEEILAQASEIDGLPPAPLRAPQAAKTIWEEMFEEMELRRRAYQAEMEALAGGGKDTRGKESLVKILPRRRL